jgi:hypothetical protein
VLQTDFSRWKKRVTWKARGGGVSTIHSTQLPEITKTYSNMLFPYAILLIARYFIPQKQIMYSELPPISPFLFNNTQPVIKLDFTAWADPQGKRQVYLSSNNNQDSRVTVKNTFQEVEHGYEWTLEVWTLIDIELHQLKATYWTDLTDIRMLANGYQSWSQTREYNEYGRISKIPLPVAWITKMNLQG